jgi:penicillin-insensitive murein endopeptidase
MTPVLNNGKSVHLPTHPFNKYGYAIEFDKKGRFKEFKIDCEALAAHLVALHKSAKKHNIGLWRVIFDPQLQPDLYKTQYAEYIRQHIQLSKNAHG